MPLIGRAAVDRAIEDLYLAANENVKGVYLAGLTQIVEGTPTGLTRADLPSYINSTSGLTRNNWFLSVGSPSSAKTTSKSNGLGAVRQLSKLPARVLGRKIYFTNNQPHIGELEYGGYPNPVKKGSKTKNGYRKLSAGGFSKQAPSGWVRIALMKMQNKIKKL